LAWFDTVRAEDLAIPASVIGELQAGAELTRRNHPAKAVEFERWIDRIMLTYAIVPIDGDTIREWVRLMVGRSQDLSEDVMIAATARIRRFIVVTRDVRDFEGLGVEIQNPFPPAQE
jgi:hypothetical protein